MQHCIAMVFYNLKYAITNSIYFLLFFFPLHITKSMQYLENIIFANKYQPTKERMLQLIEIQLKLKMKAKILYHHIVSYFVANEFYS